VSHSEIAIYLKEFALNFNHISKGVKQNCTIPVLGYAIVMSMEFCMLWTSRKLDRCHWARASVIIQTAVEDYCL